jgi:hypothetical protein
MYQNILLQQEQGIAHITINREAKLNALNILTLQEIKQAVEAANKDQSIRGIILTGAGSKAFAAGADISEFVNFSTTEVFVPTSVEIGFTFIIDSIESVRVRSLSNPRRMSPSVTVPINLNFESTIITNLMLPSSKALIASLIEESAETRDLRQLLLFLPTSSCPFIVNF